MIEVAIDTGGLDKLIGPRPEDIERFLKAVGEKAIKIILARVARGEAVDGGPFKSYSPGYVAYRESIGRNTDSDWLWLTGQMLGSFDIVETGSNYVVLGFAGSRTRAAPMSPNQRKARSRELRAARKEGRAPAALKTDLRTNAEVAAHCDEVRPFVGVREDEKREAIETAIDYLFPED